MGARLERWVSGSLRVVRDLPPAPVGAAIGLWVFFAIGGANVVWPGSTAFIAPGSDWSYHWIGWLNYRAAPWQFPIGAIPSLFHPVGTTVGYMDGIPWLAFVAKLVSPIVPIQQYIGPWLCLCFALQGWFGARLTEAFTRSRPAAALGGALFALAPVLQNRLPHEALCAHWLILAALALCVRREDTAPRVAPVVLPAIAIGVHPYLALMVLALVTASLARHVLEHRLDVRRALARLAAAVGVTVALAAAFGYFSTSAGEMAGAGFGHFNSDLLTLINPGTRSHLIPELHTQKSQWEGYGYLGLGTLLLGLSGIVVAVRAKKPLPWRRLGPPIAVAALFGLFALASQITFGGKVIVDVGWLYRPLMPLVSLFRTSGRFIWPLCYLLTMGAIAVWLTRQPRLAPWVLAACVAVQAADLRKTWNRNRFHKWKNIYALSTDWELARGDFDHLAAYPPRCGDGSGVCCPGFAVPPRVNDTYLALMATRVGLTYNGFGAARVRRAELKAYCEELDRQVQAGGALDARTIYLVDPEKRAQFWSQNRGIVCAPIDGEMACVSGDAQGAFRDRLEQRRRGTAAQRGSPAPLRPLR